MLLSAKQSFTFWSQWNALVKKNGWDKTEAELQRKELLGRAGFSSLKLVDRVDGFSRVLKELAALRDDLGGMLRADENERRVLNFKVAELGRKFSLAVVDSMPFRNPYIGAIMVDMFGTYDAEKLSDADMKKLLFTLADHAVENHKLSTLERRRLKRLESKAVETRERENCPF